MPCQILDQYWGFYKVNFPIDLLLHLLALACNFITPSCRPSIEAMKPFRRFISLSTLPFSVTSSPEKLFHFIYLPTKMYSCSLLLFFILECVAVLYSCRLPFIAGTEVNNKNSVAFRF